jgi:oxygen-independent coproporphyrinogen-3 oxidase
MARRPPLELARRFNVPTPRYTSYPTALGFEEVNAEDVWSYEQRSDSDAPVSLYFHLPFCRKLCWYCACSKKITKNQAKSGEYLQRLFRELELKREQLEGRKLVQFHLGGGTPSFFTGEELYTLVSRAREILTPAADAEFAIEIDPRELSPDQVRWLGRAGFNRASLGVQDHAPSVQRIINREQPYEMTRDAVRWLRDEGIRGVNFDLVYGLPGQTVESFRHTMDDIVELRPDRLAVYSYAHVPWVAPAQKLLERARIPGPDEKLTLFDIAAERLLDAGYEFVGMDHFALPDDELAVAARENNLHRNFMGYTTRPDAELHGLGVTAISQTDGRYFQNERELQDWEQRIDAGELPIARGVRLSEEDQRRRAIIMAIMCRTKFRFDELRGIESTAAFEAEFSTELEALGEFEEAGLIRRTENGLEVLPTGRFFVRNIARVFDAYSSAHKDRFSKAV